EPVRRQDRRGPRARLADQGRAAVLQRRRAYEGDWRMAEVPAAEEGDAYGLVKATLAFIAKSLVDHPDDVEVTSVAQDGMTTLRLHVHPEDVGRVIGRHGRLARAIRQVTRAAAAKAGVAVSIEIGA